MLKARIDKRVKQCWWHAEDGAAAAEFAIVLPLLLILLFGGFEIGRVLHDYHTVSKSVRDAGRFAARLPGGCGGFSDADDVTRIQDLALTGTVTGSGDYLLPLWQERGTVTVSLTCFDGSSTGPYGEWSGLYDGSDLRIVTVEAQAPFDFLFASLFGLPASLTLTLEHTQPHVGQ